MKTKSRILLLTILFTGFVFASFADRGTGKKRGNKITLNIKTPVSFSSSLNFNLRNGLKYSGSFVSNTKPTENSTQFYQNNFVTYQKGNSVYIIPYKQKVLVADVRQGYAGTKLIIRIR